MKVDSAATTMTNAFTLRVRKKIVLIFITLSFINLVLPGLVQALLQNFNCSHNFAEDGHGQCN